MLIFINSNGEVVGTTPLGITQGSSRANTIQLVCPFPTALVSLSFQLPNGIVLGPYLEDDYGTPANEYVMQKAFSIPGYGVEGSELTVFTYTCNKAISALPGNLGVQFFVHVGEVVAGAGADEYGGYTLAVPMIQIPVYNGTRLLPAPEIPEVSTWSDILELLSILRTDIEQTGSDLSALEGNAVLKNPILPNQTINSNVILGAGKALRADEVAATNLSTGKAEIINRGDLVFSDIGTEFKVSPILDGDVIVGLRIPGKVEADQVEASHIKSTSGDIGSIYTELGINIDANYGDISFDGDAGVGGDSIPVSYRIRANIKHDDEWDQDYVAGLAFYGEDDVFYGNVSFTKKVTLSEAIVEKTVRFFGGILGNDTQSGEIALKLDPGFGIRFDGEHDPENGYDDNGVSIVPDYGYDPETDQTRVKGLIITDGKHKIYGEVVFSDVGITFERDRATFNNPIYAYDTIHGQRAELTDAYIDGTLEVSGDLVVNGQTTTVQHETLVVKDNIIVTNSDGIQFSTSGLVINKGNGKAYGILYQPAEDLVYIGEGTYDGDKSNPTFDFDEGEAQPLAARSGSFSNNQVPVFDIEKQAFVPSGKTPADFVEKLSNSKSTPYLYYEDKNGTKLLLGSTYYTGNDSGYTVPLRGGPTSSSHPGTFEVNHPNLDSNASAYSANHPMTVGVAEGRYRKIENEETTSNNSGYVLNSEDGKKTQYANNNVHHSIPIRDDRDRFYVGTPPTGVGASPFYAANRHYVDNHVGGAISYNLDANTTKVVTLDYTNVEGNRTDVPSGYYKGTGMYIVTGGNAYVTIVDNNDVAHTYEGKFMIMTVSPADTSKSGFRVTLMYYNSILEAGWGTQYTVSGKTITIGSGSSNAYIHYHQAAPFRITPD